MPTTIRALCAAIALLCNTPFAQAEALTNYGSWTVDRLAPTGFSNIGSHQGQPDTLEVRITPANYVAPDNTYNNTQGLGHTFGSPKGVLSVAYGSVYLPTSWQDAATGAQYSVLSAFGTASTAGACTLGDDACTRYLNFAVSNTTGNAFAARDTTVNFRTSSSITGGHPDTGWVVHRGAPTLDSWNNLCIVLDENAVRHYANGVLVRTADISAMPANVRPNQINRLIVNTQNRGAAYNVHWSQLGTGTLASGTAAAGSGQSAPLSAAFTDALEVQATDTDGAPLPCVEVTFSAPATGASATLSQTTVLTGPDGIARQTATANGVAGTYNVDALLPNGISVPMALTNLGAAAPVPLSHTLSLILVALLAGMAWLQRRRVA